jgi:hypothetical protein
VDASAYLSSMMIMLLPDMIADAWARGGAGRDAASQNEVLRTFYAALATP